jgi:hypothetical protein
MIAPECLYEVIGLSSNNCTCIPAIVEIEDAFYTKSQIWQITEDIPGVQLPWDNILPQRLIVQLNGLTLIIGIHYTVLNSFVTFTDGLYAGDNLWIREI